MFKKSILTLSLISTLLFQGCSEDKTKKDANSMIATSEYVLTDLNNKQYVVKKVDQGFILDGAEDKIVIFDIFATWCPPCRGAAQHLSSLQEKYKDDLIIIGITIEEDIANEKLVEFSTTYNANYTLVNSDQNRRLSNAIVKELELGERYPIPTLAMYKDAKLVNHYVGATEEEFIDSDIRNTLGK
jgi:thiol-disulfide isomerase/thioredoxin